MARKLLPFIVFLFSFTTNAQNDIENFLKPSDSLNKNRERTVVLCESIFTASTIIALNQLWYKDYPKSEFHFINDNSEWLQMDKAGHLFSAYHLGNASMNALRWSGATKKEQVIYGATFGFAYLSAIEILDGYSAQWGASSGDVLANGLGTGLLISQELLWNEQRIVPKFSFHKTQYAAMRPNLLGKSLNEQILKDYNGQTYWLSVNLHSFFKKSKIPRWLNLAVGYGADGMISGNDDLLINNSTFWEPRTRQFYISLDADLTKIKTKYHFLKTIFSIINTIKIPAPSVEISAGGVVNFRCLYF